MEKKENCWGHSKHRESGTSPPNKYQRIMQNLRFNKEAEEMLRKIRRRANKMYRTVSELMKERG